MTFLKKGLVLLVVITCSLTACRSPVYDQSEANVANVKTKISHSLEVSDQKSKLAPALIVKKEAYVDTTPISLDSSPSWLQNQIVIRGDKLPFSYYSRTITGGGSNKVLVKFQNGLDQAVNLSINYSGTIQGALDLLASKTGYVYTIHANSILWQAFVTQTFDIAFMPGGTDYLLGQTSNSGSGGAGGGNGGGSGGSGGGSSGGSFVSSDSSSAEFSNLKGTLSIWKDLETTIQQLLSPEGRVTVSESTTSVTVRDRPSVVNLVDQYIQNVNKSLSKQVLVKVQVLEVNLENSWDFGIDWQMVFNAFNKSPFILNGNYGTPLSITTLTSQAASALGGNAPSVPQFGTQSNPNASNRVPSWTVLFNALNQQGKTSVVSEPRVLCLNNQVSVVRIVRQEGYVASIQNTSLAGDPGAGGSSNTVTSQITPGTIVTGLTLYILPKILGDKIYLQVNADLSDKLALTSLAQGQIQLPTITEKHFNQRSQIRSGDTLILSGFKQMSNKANANQFLSSQALGGKGAQALNTETIILITPIIVPSIGNA